jgi:hypothetical protein
MCTVESVLGVQLGDTTIHQLHDYDLVQEGDSRVDAHPSLDEDTVLDSHLRRASRVGRDISQRGSVSFCYCQEVFGRSSSSERW